MRWVRLRVPSWRRLPPGGRVALPGFGVSDSVGSGAGGPVPRYRPGSAFREIVGAGPGARPADAQGDSAGRQPSRT